VGHPCCACRRDTCCGVRPVQASERCSSRMALRVWLDGHSCGACRRYTCCGVRRSGVVTVSGVHYAFTMAHCLPFRAGGLQCITVISLQLQAVCERELRCVVLDCVGVAARAETHQGLVFTTTPGPKLLCASRHEPSRTCCSGLVLCCHIKHVWHRPALLHDCPHEQLHGAMLTVRRRVMTSHVVTACLNASMLPSWLSSLLTTRALS
jgi:hypothetical protein